MSVHETRDALLLLGVFALHNLEEIRCISQDLAQLPEVVRERGPWTDEQAFALATAVLTVAAGAATVGGLSTTGKPRELLVGVPAAALIGNSASHIGRVLVQRRYSGGALTAPVMGSLAARVFLAATPGQGAAQRGKLVTTGILASVPAIAGSLFLGGRLARGLRVRADRCSSLTWGRHESCGEDEGV